MGNQRTANKLGITWTDDTVNPLTGCTWASAGCDNCWAADMSPGLLAKGQTRHEGLTILNQRGHYEWTGKISWEPKELLKLTKGKPRRIFMNSVSDTFHPKVERIWQDEIFRAMLDNPQHEYQLLTKRPKLMLRYLSECGIEPQSNMLMGFSAEDQPNFDIRMREAKQIADMGWRVWVSVEPQIAPVALGDAVHDLAWVVIGGDNTKPHSHAREFDTAWAVSLIDECTAANVPVFMKQVGVRPYWTIEGVAYAYTKSTGEGKYMVEWPEEIRIQEFPAK